MSDGLTTVKNIMATTNAVNTLIGADFNILQKLESIKGQRKALVEQERQIVDTFKDAYMQDTIFITESGQKVASIMEETSTSLDSKEAIAILLQLNIQPPMTSNKKLVFRVH